MKPVRKAVIAAAGFGTRFLPQTKAMPKEMLPLVDKPIIQYVVEELVDAGIKDIIIVTNSNKRSIEDHFDNPNEDLKQTLVNGGPSKEPLLHELEAIADMANFVYVRQKGPLGNATPLMSASHLIGEEPFIYTFADDFILASPSRFKQMITAFEELKHTVLSCVQITKESDYDRYGVVGGEKVRDGLIKMKQIIEKPGKDKAPSNLASVSAYLFTPDILTYIDKTHEILEPGKEMQVQTAMQLMIDDHIDLYAYEIENGKFYDTGNKLEYIKTVIDFALQHEDLRDELQEYLQAVISK